MCHEKGYDSYRHCKSSLATLGIETRGNVLYQPINLTIEGEFLTACACIGSM